jgi:amino acid adenylation domain-containing protein
MQPPVVEGSNASGGSPATADSASIGDTLRAIWTEVLNVSRVEPEDHFFELGGDSLRAAQVVARLRERFGITAPLTSFFVAPTFSRLCELVRQELSNARPTNEPGIPRRGLYERAPATSGQRRIWFLDQLISDPAVYNVHRLIRIRGDLDVGALREALHGLAARHEALRTHFAVRDGIPEQIIGPPGPIELALHNLTELPPEEREEQAIEEARAEVRRGFSLEKGPLWRARLWRLGDEEFLFLFAAHHTVTDGWSMTVLFRDLEVLYRSAEGGWPLPLPPLAIQFGDYAAWERDRLDGDQYRMQLDYWTKKLAAPVGTLQLPFSRPRPRTQTFRGAILSFDIPDALTAAIDALARRESATRFQVALAAFEALLFRYSGQEDVVLGTAVANRGRAELESLTGFFVNTLVLRTNLGGDPTFRELLGRVRDTTFGAFAHQEVPFEALIEELRPPRDPSRQPFFQVVFLYQNMPAIPDTFGPHRLEAIPLHNGTSMFDLRLVLEDKPSGGLWAWIEYNTDLFYAGAIERLAGHFLTLLEGACFMPETPVSELPLLTAAERYQILLDWNNTAGAYPSERCIQELFEEQVRQAPDATAVVAHGQAWTYRTLNERANRLARLLRARGVGPGTLVGVCLQRSADMVTAVLAVLKAGGAYVPLDPAYPKDRLAFMLEDTKAPIVLTQARVLERLPEEVSQCLCLDRLDDELGRYSGTDLERLSGPDDLAYVIYTSGSTGRPKGVMLRHRPVVNVLDWVNTTFRVCPSDRLLFVTSLSFDLSVYDLFGVLAAGASVRIAVESELRDPASLLHILRTEPITIWDSAPAALQQLVPFFGKSEIRNTKSEKDADVSDFRFRVSELRLVLLSGDWIPVSLPDQVRGAFPHANIVSLGGATEAAIWSNWYPIGSVDASWPSIPYGKPIRNARYHILDKCLQPVPIGVPGELHIGGAVLADGYLNRPELSAERFILDPFVNAERGTRNAEQDRLEVPRSALRAPRLYKTGDLARYLPDGNIELLGRIDEQVKVRGFRVEVGEIEAVLTQHPAVREAVVRPFRDASGHVYLTAYVVGRDGRKPEPAELARQLQAQLPEHMIPAHFMVLEALPLTPNGKVDRSALQAPDHAASKSAAEYVPPAGDAERALQTVWQEVLNVHPVGVTDNFYDLGGHSLLAAVLMARIETQLGHRLPLEALFESPTVRGLAARIQRQLELSSGVLVPLQTAGTQPPLFLIAGAGGHVFAFHKFARALGPDFPVYGMKSIGVDGSESPLDRIEDIAERYFREITAAVPQGPYVLGGYSVGGLVAFELALRLRAAGRDVSRLLIFDLMAPGYPRPLPLYKRLGIHLWNFLRSSRRQKWRYLRDRWLGVRERLLFKLNLHRLEAPHVPGMDSVPQERLKRVWGGLLRARWSYWPSQRFEGKIVLVTSHRPPEWAATVLDDPHYGWGRWTTQPIELRTVPADHLGIFDDRNLEFVTTHVRQAIMETSRLQSEAMS